jgi:Zn-dependent protease with chaperone function
MTSLSFVLALGAVAFPAAWLVAAGSLVVVPLMRRLSPVPRAEASAWLALAPALVALSLAVGVSVPSMLSALGLGVDHCVGHEHHPHLCAWHGAVLPPWLALVGAAAWATFAVRMARALVGLVRAERLGGALAKLGESRSGYHLVPATVPVCHALGLVHPRVLVSRAVVDRLDARSLRAVLAHEQAHVDRSDPRWSALLELAVCVAPFASRWTRVWREAAEEAADDAAAASTDGVTVAHALVTVARLRLDGAPGFAFGATDLERRVNRLLGGRVSPRRSRTLMGALMMISMAVVLVAGEHERLHHVVEETWEFFVAG